METHLQYLPLFPVLMHKTAHTNDHFSVPLKKKKLLLYNAVLVSAVQQHESVISIYSLSLSVYLHSLLSLLLSCFPPLQVITEHWAELPALHSTFSLVLCFTHNSEYMPMLLSQFVLPSPSPAVFTSPFSTFASPILPCKQFHQYYLSRLHIYAYIYICYAKSLQSCLTL